jgi:hypothetical protein
MVINNGVVVNFATLFARWTTASSPPNASFTLRESIICRTIDNGVWYDSLRIKPSEETMAAPKIGIYVQRMFTYKDRVLILYSNQNTYGVDASFQLYVIKKVNGIVSSFKKSLTSGTATTSSIVGRLPINASGLLNGYCFDKDTGKLYCFQNTRNSPTVYFSIGQYDEATDTFVAGAIKNKVITLSKGTYNLTDSQGHAGMEPKFLLDGDKIHIVFPGYMYDDVSWSLRYVAVDLGGNIIHPDTEIYKLDGKGVHNFDIVKRTNGNVEIIFGVGLANLDTYLTTTSVKGDIYKAIFSTNTTTISYSIFSREDGVWYPVAKNQVVNFTNPTNAIRVKANMTTPSLTLTPEIIDITIDCSDAESPPIQEIVSNKITINEMVDGEATFDSECELNNGSVSWKKSNDGGATWIELNNGDKFMLDPINVPNLRIKAILERGVGEVLLPKINSYRIIKKEVAITSTP